MKRKMEDQPWWPKLVAQKDEKSLRELSAEFGVSPAAISNAFKRNSLKRKPARSGPRTRKAATADGAKPSSRKKAVAAKRVGRPKRSEASVKAMSSKRAPRKARTASAPARRASAATARKRRVSVLEQYQDQMGKVVDREIAEKAGVTVSAVTNYRKRHNIPPLTGRGRPRRTDGGAQASQAKASRSAGLQAYEVKSGEDTVVVVATTIVEAAQRATAAGRGEVTKIKRIGPALA